MEGARRRRLVLHAVRHTDGVIWSHQGQPSPGSQIHVPVNGRRNPNLEDRIMWAKTFASMYEGSMAGSGPVVFSVWGYIIANTYKEHVLLNPPIVCAKIGITREEFDQAVGFLSAPDPNSQTPDEEGRRIISSSGHQWFVINSQKYQDFKSADEKAEYNRTKQREYRERKKAQALPSTLPALVTVKSVNDCQTLEKSRQDETKPDETRSDQTRSNQPKLDKASSGAPVSPFFELEPKPVFKPCLSPSL